MHLLLASLAIPALAWAAEVSVYQVDFRLVDQPGRGDSWYRVEVGLDVGHGGPPAERNSRFVDRVKVEAALSFETERADGRGFDFYSSEVSFPALAVGRHVARFYLPPEIVERDRLRGEPFAFEIAVSDAGGSDARLASRNLGEAAAVERFRSLARESSPVNEGILLPQHLTPFWLSEPDNSPSPVRVQGRD